ncbi:hypothetical protein HPP92_026918 [Vanilla planifolia]|uniref:Uncharacterized protein n=1 Tax=Vanilla planifolia TaxID=51239 RepID=A0A835U782_VANPL|nr:hypothetical protein HPP92_026918 [Vanilla planifolia]
MGADNDTPLFVFGGYSLDSKSAMNMKNKERGYELAEIETLGTGSSAAFHNGDCGRSMDGYTNTPKANGLNSFLGL